MGRTCKSGFRILNFLLFSSPVGNQAGVRRTPHQGTFTPAGEWSEGYIDGAVRQPS